MELSLSRLHPPLCPPHVSAPDSNTCQDQAQSDNMKGKREECVILTLLIASSSAGRRFALTSGLRMCVTRRGRIRAWSAPTRSPERKERGVGCCRGRSGRMALLPARWSDPIHPAGARALGVFVLVTGQTVPATPPSPPLNASHAP